MSPSAIRSLPSDSAKSCQPALASTSSPTRKPAWREATTRLTVPPTIGLPSATGGA